MNLSSYDMVSDESIQQTLRDFEGDKAVNQLIEQALAAGGKDNITIMLAENNH